MRSFLRVVFVLFLFSFHKEGNATRYLPSIVWDNLNPMLSCKCNWFHPIALIEIYDRFEFVCPTTRIHTLLLNKRSRPVDHMNLNIFQRKWKGGIDAKGMNELKKQMMSGEFCDPTHKDTKKIFTCKMGAPDGHTIRFAGDAGFYKDDIVVYFNNRDDGRKTSLTSTEKRCAMAFVTKATWNVAKKYDFTYGKNLDELLPQCRHVNTTCKEEASTQPTTSLPSTTPSTTTGSSQTTLNSKKSNEALIQRLINAWLCPR
ncbi:Hypothetical predicted protein [Paramuricea clavata]|uniref:Uncharacterized protein n=1 Tax=Paramuricea clavata TaxID=317549 RepID=A0A6S7H210_PARCT|nr:Hypothetical predicted protein [Paramuricea clavata]